MSVMDYRIQVIYLESYSILPFFELLIM